MRPTRPCRSSSGLGSPARPACPGDWTVADYSRPLGESIAPGAAARVRASGFDAGLRRPAWRRPWRRARRPERPCARCLRADPRRPRHLPAARLRPRSDGRPAAWRRVCDRPAPASPRPRPPDAYAGRGQPPSGWRGRGWRRRPPCRRRSARRRRSGPFPLQSRSASCCAGPDARAAGCRGRPRSPRPAPARGGRSPQADRPLESAARYPDRRSTAARPEAAGCPRPVSGTSGRWRPSLHQSGGLRVQVQRSVAVQTVWSWRPHRKKWF
jgi:hypothetical protein